MRQLLLLLFVFVTFGGFFVQPEIAQAAPPTCDFFYANQVTTVSGQGIDLNWETTGATSAEIVGVGPVPLDGTTSVTVPFGPGGFYDYELIMTYDAYGTSQTVSCFATIVIEFVIDAETPICNFAYASPGIGPPGSATTITWDIFNTTGVGGPGGSTNQTDTVVDTYSMSSEDLAIPAISMEYDNGTSTIFYLCPISGNVYPPTIDRFEPTTATVTPGSTFTMNWDVYGDNFTVMLDDDGNSIPTFVTGVGSVDLTAPAATGTYTYSLLVEGFGFETPPSAFQTVQLFVEEAVAPPPPPTCDTFEATPDTFVGSGNTSLEWTTTGADSVSIDNGIGAVGPNDSTDAFLVDVTTDYELTATNAGGSTTCTATVTVTAPPPPPTPPPAPSSSGGGGSTRVPEPQCIFFEPSTKEAIVGDLITLSFETKNADLVTIYEGKVSDDTVVYTVTPGSSKAGAAAVTVSDTTSYTLVAEKGRRTDECSTTITLLSPSLFGGAGFGQNEGAILLTEVPETGYQISQAGQVMLYTLLIAGTLFVLFMGMHVSRLGIFATQSTVKYGKFTPISAAADHALRVHRTRSLLVIALLVVLIVLLAVQLV